MGRTRLSKASCFAKYPALPYLVVLCLTPDGAAGAAAMTPAPAAGGDEEMEQAALEVCKEAEITAIVLDSQPANPPVFLDSTPKSFLRYAPE